MLQHRDSATTTHAGRCQTHTCIQHPFLSSLIFICLQFTNRHLCPPPLSACLQHPPSLCGQWPPHSLHSEPTTCSTPCLLPIPPIPINGSVMNISHTSGRNETRRRRWSVLVAWGWGLARGMGEEGDLGCQGASLVEKWRFSS